MPAGTRWASGTRLMDLFSCLDWLASVLPRPVKVTFFMLPLLAARRSFTGAAECLASMQAGQYLSVVVHSDYSVRARFLEQRVPGLLRDHFHVIQTTNSESDLSDPETSEGRLALIIDNAHLPTDQTFRYRNLVVSVTSVAVSPFNSCLSATHSYGSSYQSLAILPRIRLSGAYFLTSTWLPRHFLPFCFLRLAWPPKRRSWV